MASARELDALMGRAMNAHQAGRIAEAQKFYKAVLKDAPKHFPTLHFLGLTYFQEGKPQKGVEFVRKALAIKPDYVEARYNLAAALQGIGRFDDAIVHYKQALAINPNSPDAHNNLGGALHKLKRYEEAVAHFQQALAIRPGLAQSHNNIGSALRARIVRAFDHFIDVSQKSDQDIASLIREMEIDVAIDLTGFTENARIGILAMRPAPTQVNYLGYPGTTGADYFDYIIADRIVSPVEHQPFYSEKVTYLPHTYQPTDTTREIPAAPLSRQDVGLPDSGFVFCSFNNSFKITPEIFDIWMRLLQSVDGSVLWLLEGHPASDNLKREAQKRDVSPERLIFAPRVDPDIHLARHRLADVFLDTLPYNAHTTSSDALWAGLPVLTCLGTAFAGRVAASIVTAAGLPELVTHSLQEYEALALRLAREPDLLASIKTKLAGNRLTQPLFDSARFATDLETTYTAMWEQQRKGLTPESFSVEPHV